jgi:hypothetical protein
MINLYENSTSLYYPVVKAIDLRLVIRVERKPDAPGKENIFIIITEARKYKFQADTSVVMQEWYQKFSASCLYYIFKG